MTDTNYIKNGETIDVKCTIDNTEGSAPIENISLCLEERVSYVD